MLNELYRKLTGGRFIGKTRNAPPTPTEPIMANEASKIVAADKTPVELCTWEFYDTRQFLRNDTQYLEFFGGVNRANDTAADTNAYGGQLLWGSQRFLIQSVRLFGITSPLTLGVFELCIGNKIYMQLPAWRLAIREKYRQNIPMLVSPEYGGQVVICRLQWKEPVKDLGRGLDGKKKAAQSIQVILRGQIARPIQ